MEYFINVNFLMKLFPKFPLSRRYDLMRPVNLMPLERDVINTQFILRTRDNLQVGRTRKDQGQRRTRQGQRRTRGRVGLRTLKD